MSAPENRSLTGNLELDKAAERRQRVNGRFAPGTCGNPGGRPKATHKIKLQLVKACPGHLRALNKLAADPKTPSDVRARIHLWFAERVLGKAPIEITGADGSPLMPGHDQDSVEIAKRVAFLLQAGLSATNTH